MKIKDRLVLNDMTWEAVDDIKYNTIDAFQTSESTTPGYYIVLWTDNAYTLQEKHTCHVFDPPVIIPEGEILFPSKFMTPMRNTSYWYHGTDEAISVMVKLKQVVMRCIALIQDNNTTTKFPSYFEGYADIKPNTEHDVQIILDQF